MRRLPAAEVLPLPISRPALLSALEDLLSEPWAEHEVDAPASKQHDDVAEALHELVQDRDDLLSEDDDLDRLITAPPPVAPMPRCPSASRCRGVRGSREPAGRDRRHQPAVAAHASRDVLAPEPVNQIEPLEVTMDDLAETHGDVADDSGYDHPPLSAVPRTRSTRPMPPSTYATSRDDIEALRPTAPARRSPRTVTAAEQN